MEKFIRADAALRKLFDAGKADLIIAPNSAPAGSDRASQAAHHGDFDDDERTVQATFVRLTATTAAKAGKALAALPVAKVEFQRSRSSLRERRLGIDARTQLNR